jgi:hypothetical protein
LTVIVNVPDVTRCHVPLTCCPVPPIVHTTPGAPAHGPEPVWAGVAAAVWVATAAVAVVFGVLVAVDVFVAVDVCVAVGEGVNVGVCAQLEPTSRSARARVARSAKASLAPRVDCKHDRSHSVNKLICNEPPRPHVGFSPRTLALSTRT